MPETPKDPAAVAALCEALGLDGGDLIDAIKLLAAVKSDAPKEEKEHEPAKKIYGDKEFVFETRQDVFIYKDLRTKSKRYYVRIYDAKKEGLRSKFENKQSQRSTGQSREDLCREERSITPRVKTLFNQHQRTDSPV